MTETPDAAWIASASTTTHLSEAGGGLATFAADGSAPPIEGTSGRAALDVLATYRQSALAPDGTTIAREPLARVRIVAAGSSGPAGACALEWVQVCMHAMPARPAGRARARMSGGMHVCK